MRFSVPRGTVDLQHSPGSMHAACSKLQVPNLTALKLCQATQVCTSPLPFMVTTPLFGRVLLSTTLAKVTYKQQGSLRSENAETKARHVVIIHLGLQKDNPTVAKCDDCSYSKLTSGILHSSFSKLKGPGLTCHGCHNRCPFWKVSNFLAQRFASLSASFEP